LIATEGLPKLSPAQEQKLRLLSLLPIARQQSNLSYKSLQSALSLDSPQALESLITTAIYTNLITGTIDPANLVINITSVAPLRDLAPGSVPSLAAALTQWSSQCTSMLAELESEVNKIKREAKLKGVRNDRVQELVEEKTQQAEDAEKGRPKRGALDLRDEEGDETMEVDGGQQGHTMRSGRVSKRLGLGRHG
jgi:COP9 signalosome complex subunit 7